MNIKQVTVFGGAGFIGRAIVRALAPQGYLVRVACRRIELAEPLKTAGDVGQITLMRANLRMPRVGGRRRRRQPGRDQCRGHSLPARPPALSARSMSTAPGRSPRRRAPRASSGWSICRASAPTAAARRTATSNPRSRPRTPSSPASRAPRSCGRAWCSGPTTRMFNRLAKIAAQAPFMPVVGNGRAKVQPVFAGDVGAGRGRRAGAARHGQKRVRAGRARASTPIARSPPSPCARSAATSRSSACRPA